MWERCIHILYNCERSELSSVTRVFVFGASVRASVRASVQPGLLGWLLGSAPKRFPRFGPPRRLQLWPLGSQAWRGLSVQGSGMASGLLLRAVSLGLGPLEGCLSPERSLSTGWRWPPGPQLWRPFRGMFPWILASETEIRPCSGIPGDWGSLRSHFAESGPPPRRFTASYWSKFQASRSSV